MPETSELEELNLVKAIKEGNQDLLVKLYEKYEKKLLRFFYVKLGNFHDAENLLCDTFIKVFRNIQNFKQESTFSTWLFSIANNLVIDHYRKHARTKNLFSDLDYNLGYEQPQYNDDIEMLKKCLNELDKRERSVIVMRYMENETLKSIAKSFDISHQRVAQITDESKNKLLMCLKFKLE